MPTRLLKVFLCHASVDKPAVRKLYRYLRDRKMDPWLDAENLMPGHNWQVEIPKALLSSDVIIICLSKSSVDKEGYVQKEIKFALDKALEMPEGRIFLIPARLEECDLPHSLSAYHYVNLFEEDGYRRLLKSLRLRAEQIGAANVAVGQDTILPNAEDAGHVEREAAEKAAREKAELDAVEKAEREKAERDAQEKAEREAAEKAACEKAERDAVERAEREKAERDAQEKVKRESAEKAERGKKIEPVVKKPFETQVKLKQQGFTKPPGWSIGLIVAFLAAIIWGISSIPAALEATQTPSAMQPLLPTLGIGSTMISEKGETLVYVPAGEFSMGSKNGNLDEKPVHTVYLDAFWIDQTEVTNKQYQTCVDASMCEPPSSISSNKHPNYYGNPEFNNYPVVYVNWDKANRYCEIWAGGDLPTEAQWEKAARGTDGRTYPWGEDIDCDKANYNGSCVGDTTLVGSYESGKSPYVVYDMAGNVREWVNDWYADAYYKSSFSSNPLGPDSGVYRVLRGGAWDDLDNAVRSALRNKVSHSDSYVSIGFRCARSP